MKSLFEQMGGTYREENGYLIPNLTLPDEEQVEIGVWRQRHLRYIKQHHKVRYTNLLTSGKLNGYLADIDKKAEDMFFRLVKQMAERAGVTEQLKADNQMEWIAQMNNICSRATEIVNHDIIYELTENGGREIDFPLLPFSTVTVEKSQLCSIIMKTLFEKQIIF